MTGKWNCLLEVSTRYGGIIIVILLFNWGKNSMYKNVYYVLPVAPKAQKCVVFI